MREFEASRLLPLPRKSLPSTGSKLITSLKLGLMLCICCCYSAEVESKPEAGANGDPIWPSCGPTALGALTTFTCELLLLSLLFMLYFWSICICCDVNGFCICEALLFAALVPAAATVVSAKEKAELVELLLLLTRRLRRPGII